MLIAKQEMLFDQICQLPLLCSEETVSDFEQLPK